MADLEALKRAAEAATPGPWVVWSSLYEHMDAQLRSADGTVEGVALAEFYRLANGFKNAEFARLANPATILDLLSERTALLEKLETARKDRDAAEAAVDAAKAEVSEAVSRWCIRMADVREASGIGHKPMLDEVPGAIKARISEIEARAQAAETKLATLTGALSSVLPWAEIGRFLWEERSICYGDGYTQPYERAIEWGWQQSTPSCSAWKAMRGDVDAWIASFGDDGGDPNGAPFSDARQALAAQTQEKNDER